MAHLLSILLLLAAQEIPSGDILGTGPGADPGELFVTANTAYEAGDHGRAVELYRRLVATGAASGHVYYDLGNAYLRSGELGRAIAAYRRSQALLPRDGDVAANLAFARKSARDAIAPPAPSPILATLFFWHYSLSWPELLRLAALLNALFWGAVILRLFRRRSEVLRWIATGLLALLLAAAGSLAVRLAAPTRIAVVLPQEIDAHAGTGRDTVVRFKLHAGTELRVIERREGWLRIALPDGQGAWIEADHAEVVTL